MAANLPVICTEAAGDIHRRLPDGKAGYVIPPADAAQLADRMLQLAGDATLRRAFGAEGQCLVANRVHEQWASDFEAFVERVLSMPPRRTPQSALARAAGLSILAGLEGSLGSSLLRATVRRPRPPSGEEMGN